MKTISYDDYLRLVGLLHLAKDHRTALRHIERSALGLLGVNGSTQVDDAVWGGYHYDAATLLELLGIAMPAAPADEGGKP